MIDQTECHRLDRRRRIIIEASRELFVEQGFEHTTLSDIVDRAGGSLATVYKLFGNKEGILDVVVFEKASSGAALVRKAAEKGGTPVEILHRLSVSFQEHFLDPEMVALVRIVIARSVSNKDFARRFFERTSTRTHDSLQQLFSAWQEKGIEMNARPQILAQLFLGLFVSDVHAEAISHHLGTDKSLERLHARIEFFVAGAGLLNDKNAGVLLVGAEGQ